MLKPVTEREKAEYTLKIQTGKAIEEILTELYFGGYEGFVDIWPVVKPDKKTGKLVLEVKSKKTLIATAKMADDGAARYHIAQGKGFKMIKQPNMPIDLK